MDTPLQSTESSEEKKKEKKKEKENRMKLLLSFDLEEYDKGGSDKFQIGYKGGEIVRNLLEGLNITSTFFVTTSFYREFPDFVKDISREHEIAFHGLTHQDDYRSMAGEAAFRALFTGKSEIEKGISQHIIGFRAPRMRPPSYKMLKKVGFMYSSSLHPTYVPGRYNHFRDSRTPFWVDDVLEIPVSVAPVIRLPLSWVWFRQCGVVYAKVLTLLQNTGYLAIYFHPWEFIPLQKGGFVYTRNTGPKMVRAVKKFLKWICMRADPVRMAEYASAFLKT